MGRAILASAAISGLVLPITARRAHRDGRRLGAQLPVRARVSQPRGGCDRRVPIRRELSADDPAFLERTRERLERFRAVPPVRALLAEVRLAQERASRGEPAHYGELIVRLMRVAFARNAVVEERIARERETSVAELTGCARTCRRGGLGGCAVAPAAPARRARGAVRRGALPVPPRPARPDADRPRRPPGDASLDPTFRSERTVADEAQARADRARLHAHRRGACGAAGRPLRRSTKKVGRGPGRRSDPLPMRDEQAPAHRGLLAASPGGRGAAVRA